MSLIAFQFAKALAQSDFLLSAEVLTHDGDHHEDGLPVKNEREPADAGQEDDPEHSDDAGDEEHCHHEDCQFEDGRWMCSAEPNILVKQDRKFYADISAKRALAAASGAEFNGPELVALADTFFLHSNPTASKTIYLDFDGNTTIGTSWNSSYGVNTIVSPAYDPDNNGASFTDNEKARIQRIWQRVAEDYSPFDVNVTTEDPGEAALVNTGGADTEWGIRIVVTIDNFASCGCGGFAYIDSFNWNYQSGGATDTPAFVFNSSEIGVSGASSHEAGHAVGLSHDGTTASNPIQPSATYYHGHGAGETGWGPIMGSGYYSNVTTWDLGEFYGANNGGANANYGDGPDDIAIITTQNGFGFRPDDHGDDFNQASSVTYLGQNLANIELFGVIEDHTDLDFIEFDTADGIVDITIDSYLSRVWTSNGAGSYGESLEGADFGTDWPKNQGSNLDVEAILYDSIGQPIATSNPAGLSASFTGLNLAAGRYYISVDGVGFGSPSANPPSGYTDYGSIGQYLVSGTVVPVPDGLNLNAVAVAADKDEGNSATTDFGFDITMSETHTEDVTVDWAVTGSGPSPADSSDFAGGFPAGTATISAGLTSVAISVQVSGDTDIESDETFTVSLNNPSAGEVFGAALGTIRNDDVPLILFADGFEGAEWGNLWVEDSQNDWFRSTQRATEGSRSAEVDGRATNATLTLNNNGNPIDISGAASASLTFDWLIENGFDSGEFLALDVSHNGGTTWTQDVRRLNGNVDPENVWHSETVDLLPYSSGANLKIRFRSSVNNSREDANVDNVIIEAGPSGPANEPPLADNDDYNVDEDNTLTVDAPGVLTDDSDPEDDPLTAILVSDAANGSVTLQANGAFDYTPDTDFNGEDSFTYKANDGIRDSNVATVTITVAPVNDAPVASGQSVTLDQDTLAEIALIATDADEDGLTYVIDPGPAHGTLSGAAPNLTYTPTANYIGPDSFTFKVNDGAIDSNLAVVTITVQELPNEVILFADSFEGPEWGNLWVEDNQNDWFRSTQRETDGIRSAEVDGRASNATLTLNNNGTAIDIAGYASATLTFDWFIEGGFDSGEFLALDVSHNGGTNWTQDVRRLNGNVDQENVWRSETVDLLPSFTGSNLKIRFRSSVSKSNEDANVDNVRIVASSVSQAPQMALLAAAALPSEPEMSPNSSPSLANGSISSIALTSSSNVKVGFSSKMGSLYRLEKSFDLLTWDAIGTEMHGTGTDILATDPQTRETSPRQAYYRIQVLSESELK